MNTYSFTFAGQRLVARPSGALHWPAAGLLCVSDLHLGKSARQARRNGVQLPPYDVEDTLARLEAEVEATAAATVICLGDSFDDLQAFDALPLTALDWITRLQAGRRWIWIEGNHDPGPVGLGGLALGDLGLVLLVGQVVPADPGEPHLVHAARIRHDHLVSDARRPQGLRSVAHRGVDELDLFHGHGGFNSLPARSRRDASRANGASPTR